MDLQSSAPRDFFAAIRASWFDRLFKETTLFADALETWLYELPVYPAALWPDRFEEFVSEQESAGRILSSDSRQEIINYLDDWAASLRPAELTVVVHKVEELDSSWPERSDEARARTRAEYGLPGWYAAVLEWGDAEWEDRFEALGRTSRDQMLQVCRELSVLGNMANEPDKLADDGLEELAAQRLRVLAAHDAYVLSLIDIQAKWLSYIKQHSFIGLQVQKLILKLEGALPPRLFDLTSKHSKALATIANDVNKALGAVVSRVDTAYTVAVWTDRAITVIEALTAVGGGARLVFKAAIKVGFARNVAVRMAIKYGIKQLAIQATAYVAAGYALPPLIAAAGLNQDFVFTGLMVVQGLGVLHALRSARVAGAPEKTTPSHGSLDRDAIDNNFDLHPGSIKEKFKLLDEPDRTLLGPQVAQDLSEGVVGPRGVWDLAPSPRGKRIEQWLGQNLPDTFPVFDKFSDGVATSIKSLDTWMPTYRNPNSIFSACRKYVDAIADYKKGKRQGYVITADLIHERRLDLAVPPDVTSSQRAALNEVAKYGQAKSVVVTIIEIANSH